MIADISQALIGRPTIVLLMLLLLIDPLIFADGIRWLSVAQLSSVGLRDATLCRQLRGLTKKQVKVCRRNTRQMVSVQIGARLAINECQFQFRNRRWNCSMIDTDSVFGYVLDTGTRETAFVHAISSAGVAHAVTRDCSQGKLGSRCGCDYSLTGSNFKGFQWSGCSDNVHYGSIFSKKFVDAYERRKKQNYDRYLMNLHNNEAGRKAIESNMNVQCKCHGVSGSCEMKTCWRRMPSFRQIGDILRGRFDGATEVKMSSKYSDRKVLEPVNSFFKAQTVEDLVYLEPSPNFCDFNNQTGSLGTVGRSCNVTSKAMDGCDLMCCGRGFVEQQQVINERCQCKFYWCCQVKCKTCTQLLSSHSCL